MTRDELATLATRPYALTPKRSHYHALQQAWRCWTPRLPRTPKPRPT